MRAADIVNKLAVRLPTFVDDFTTNHSVSSLTLSGNTVTATTDDPHSLSIGDAVNIVGAKTPIVINSISRTGILATLITAIDHDVTETLGFENIEIEGATEPEFNGIFKRLNVLNRRTITIQVDDSGPLTATGSPLLLNGENIFNTYNGLQEITAAPSSTTFEYILSNSGLFTPASGVIFAKERPLISAGVSYERILSSYTPQITTKTWLFVVMGDALAQKNRQITVDSTDNLQKTHYFNQRITQVLSLYLFIPSTTEIAARQARDRAEELFLPICQSILLSKFDTLLSEKFVNPLQFNGHRFHDYNTAFYVHEYTFEQTLQMTFEDTVGADDDVAFRDICLTMGLDVGTETFDTDIDLDDEPLFSPPDTSSLIFWLDADDASTISGSVIGPGSITEVEQWNDKSGFNKNVIQDNVNRIFYPLSNLSNINGRNVISFDGQANTLFHIDISGNVLVSGSQAATIFSVSRIVGDSSAGASNTLFSFGPSNPLGGQIRGLDINSDSNLSGYRFNDGDRLFNGNPWGTSAKVSTWTWANGATYDQQDLYVNGILQSQNSSSNPSNVPNIIDDQILIGAMLNLTGLLINMGKIDIGEIVFYDRQLPTDERETVESYLTDKWGVS